MSQLLLGDELRDKLSVDFNGASKIKIISAYLTMPAIEWLQIAVKNNPDIQILIVSRISPKDIVTGGTDLKALRECLKNGWQINALANLHAKIYLIDEIKIYVGSSNFTSNGLKLYGDGNLETMVEVVPEVKDVEFVNDIISSSDEIDEYTIDAMEAYIQECGLHGKVKEVLTWPEEIMPASKDIWVSDFPLSPPLDLDKDAEYGPIFQRIISIKVRAEMLKAFKETKAYIWLYGTLQSMPNNEAYFGNLTKALHDHLKDDPGPYRKDVKQLLNNLLAFCEMLSIDEIVVDKPNYSQCIKLII